VEDLAKQEGLVDRYVKEENKEAAVKLLFDLITTYAEKKDFQKAEHLRDKLYEVDPLALPEIIKAGEIIEEQKASGIDESHLELWSDLYQALTSEEGNALYYAMKEASLRSDEPVFRQGERNSNLYFINEGELKQVYSQEGREVLLRTFGKGHIAGDDSFFSNELCTTSLITLTPVKLNYLEKRVLGDWKEAFPGLESHLSGYCRKFDKVHDLLKQKDLDRRTQERIHVSGKAVIRIMDKSGALVGKPFKGQLSDISVGGLAFFIKISKKETASLLLGRRLSITFPLPGPQGKAEITQAGTVVGVRFHTFDDYSIHVRFHEPLSKDRFYSAP